MGTMIIQNYTLMLSSILKKRLFFVAATLDSTPMRKMCNSSKASLNTFEPEHLFKSVFETSAKAYLDVSKIHLLEKFFQPTNEKTCTYNFVIDEVIAKDIVRNILSKTDHTKSIIFEGNPGLGLITLNLINSGASHLYVCDSSKLHLLTVSQILQKHPDKVTLKNININKHSDSLFTSAFDEAQKQNFNVTFITVTTSFYLLRLIVVIFFKNGLWKNKFEIYLILSSLVYNGIQNFSPSHFKFLYYCAFNLLFFTEKIANYPGSAFLPVLKTNDNEDFNLIKLSLNPNIFKNFDENELIEYIIFVTILGSSCTNVIIPTLEKWLPDCGPYLIAKGISMSNRVQDLSSQESIILFKIFKKCEGYNNFKLCINHAFQDTSLIS